MSQWEKTSLKEVALKVNTGADAITRAPIVDYDSGIRCLRIQNVSNSHEFRAWGFCDVSKENYPRFSLKKGDILIARTGNTIGVNMYIEEDLVSVFNNGLIRLRFNNKKVIPKYIYYLFKTHFFEGHIKSIAYGTSTQPNMQIESLLRFDFECPPLEVQNSITTILSCLDRKIENLRKQNETLEEIAGSIFKHWFIDFEFPNADGKPYKSSGGVMVRSELGDIPEGWNISTIGNEVETVGGGTPSTSEPTYWEDGDITWYSPTDLTRAKTLFSIDSEKKITKLGLQKSSARLFPKYSLLLTSRATIGEVTISTKDACTNQGFITIVPNLKFSIHFLYGWLLTKISTIKNLASGSTFPEISKSNFRGLDFIVPLSHILEDYEVLAEPIYKKIENNIFQVQTLIKTRDTLLPKLMSGQLRINI